MELTKGSICPECGKNFSKIEGDCEVNRDKSFYGGRVSFFQIQKCNCGRKYKLCIGQTSEGLKVIDMIVLEDSKSIEDDKHVAHKEEVDNTNVADPIVKEEKEEVTVKPQIVAEIESVKKRLLMLTKKELQTLLRRRKISFDKHLTTKEQLVEKLLLRNPTGVGLFKY